MNPRDLPEAARRAAVLKALSDEVKRAVERGKASLKPVLDELDIDTMGASLSPDGPRVAEVYRGGGNATAEVVNEDKYLAWVKETNPGEVIEAVRPTYTAELLKQIARTGEIVPGVELGLTTAYVAVRYEPGGQAALTAAWREGLIDISPMLALPASPDGGEPGE